MAKNPYDPFGSTEPGYGAGPGMEPGGIAGNYSYQPPDPSQPHNTGVFGPTPGAPPPPPSFDRTAFRDKWMGSSGSMDDFLKNNPEFSGVHATNSKNGTYQLPSGELMDLQIAKGANGDNAAHGWTGVGEVHNGQASYYPPAPAMGQFGGPGGAAGGPNPNFNQDIKSTLQGIFSNQGNFNQDVVNRRTENARENLARFQKSQSANDKSVMASRGLVGSGAELTGQGKLGQDIANSYQNAASGIYADESHAADQRMMQALTTAAGMSEQEAQQAIDWFNSQTGRTNMENNFTLGQGNLALNDSKNKNDYDLGRRGIDFNYDQLNSNLDDKSVQDLIDLLKTRGTISTDSAKGYY
jgi:hypothetical protein